MIQCQYINYVNFSIAAGSVCYPGFPKGKIGLVLLKKLNFFHASCSGVGQNSQDLFPNALTPRLERRNEFRSHFC